MNTLTGMKKKIAKASKTPGRTQAINLFKCSDKEGELCIFVDLPGYGYAEVSKSRQAEITDFMRMYLENRGALRLVCVLVDARRSVQDTDLGLLQFLRREGLQHVVVATKVDKLKRPELEANLAGLREALDLPDGLPLAFSSVSGEGVRSVLSAVRQGLLAVDEDDEDDGEEEDGEEEEVWEIDEEEEEGSG